MLTSKTIDKIIFLDLESTSQYPTFKAMPENFQEIFKKRFKGDIEKMDINWDEERQTQFLEKLYDAKAPLYPEYAKILCISIGWFVEKDIINGYAGDLSFKMKSFYGEDEPKLLKEFYVGLKSILDASFNHSHHLCAFAGMIFDFPMIARRFMLNKLPIPNALDYTHKKPWDLEYLVDPALVYKYNTFDGGGSLDMLAATFGIESSKQEMDGSQVKSVYWTEKDLAKIERYCKADVAVLAQVYLAMKCMFNKVTVL